ncbi:MAG: cysteine hydrolase family protein [Acidimicrobiales bacterium]|nr:cysteine hydrolase family protein [Acidimicrobiales bacterium]
MTALTGAAGAAALAAVSSADPYPWPWQGAWRAERTALLVAGAQPAWATRSCDTEAVGSVIAEVATALRNAGGFVVALRHLGPPAGARRSAVGLPPAAQDPDAALLDVVVALADLVVDAGGINGFHGGRLDDELRGRRIEQLVLCGFGAEATVDCTLRAANDRGYECLTLTDAVAPFEAETGRRALHSITMSGGIFGAIGPSAGLLAALAPTPIFQEQP